MEVKSNTAVFEKFLSDLPSVLNDIGRASNKMKHFEDITYQSSLACTFCVHILSDVKRVISAFNNSNPAGACGLVIGPLKSKL